MILVATQDSNLPFGKLPPIWSKSHVIKQIEGTRWFVEESHMVNFRDWLNEIHLANPGDLLPMQWVPMLVRVSRQAVHKRATAGNLTVFSFIPREPRPTFLGRSKPRESRSSFDYVLISECHAWREEIWDRMNQEHRQQEEEELARGNEERLPRALRFKKKGKK